MNVRKLKCRICGRVYVRRICEKRKKAGSQAKRPKPNRHERNVGPTIISAAADRLPPSSQLSGKPSSRLQFPAIPEFRKPAVAGDDQGGSALTLPRGGGQMAPKKKQPASKQKQKPKPSSSSSSSSSAAAAAPRLQISSENERRLRRLLLNSSASAAPSPASTDGPGARGESREQKARRLRGVYDKLALEGFTSAQIEQALSAIPVSIPFPEHTSTSLCVRTSNCL